MIDKTTIYKYFIDTEHHIAGISSTQYDIDMHEGAEILSVGLQCGRLCIWARVNPKNPMETRHVFVVGTGWTVEDTVWSPNAKFIGTVFIGNGIFVYHIFA